MSCQLEMVLHKKGWWYVCLHCRTKIVPWPARCCGNALAVWKPVPDMCEVAKAAYRLGGLPAVLAVYEATR